jgi:3-oxoadipate enol-lactonase
MPIHYQLDGTPGAPVLMFSNSLGADLSMWNPQVHALSGQFRILRYDTRGHGQSEVSPGPYTLDRLGRDVLQLLDELGLAEVNFCGLSMGGLTGLWLALHAPQRIRRLILSNTGAKLGTAEMWNARVEQVRAGGMASIVEVTLERWLGAAFRTAHPDQTDGVRQMILGTPVEGYLANCAAIRDADLREDASGIRVPTLVISGANDPAAPAELGRFLADKIEGARYRELPAAHLANIEAAEEYNHAIVEFLS